MALARRLTPCGIVGDLLLGPRPFAGPLVREGGSSVRLLPSSRDPWFAGYSQVLLTCASYSIHCDCDVYVQGPRRSLLAPENNGSSKRIVGKYLKFLTSVGHYLFGGGEVAFPPNASATHKSFCVPHYCTSRCCGRVGTGWWRRRQHIQRTLVIKTACQLLLCYSMDLSLSS